MFSRNIHYENMNRFIVELLSEKNFNWEQWLGNIIDTVYSEGNLKTIGLHMHRLYSTLAVLHDENRYVKAVNVHTLGWIEFIKHHQNQIIYSQIR